MKYEHNTSSRRATRDIDFALEIDRIEKFKELKNYLINQEGFVEEHKFRLKYRDTELDLAPFGSLEEEDGYDIWVSPLCIKILHQNPQTQ
ncbi:MAG: hypothetical protein NW226_06245 [Microscillaceae bacterium]|nr:hypothetical protein [Microscillaceae bacterium]